MPTPTIHELLARRRDLTLNRDADGLAELYAPNAVIEMPFLGPTGTPMRVEGRESIRAYARAVVASPVQLESYEVVGCHLTQDPEVVIVEMQAEVRPTANHKSVTTESIQVLRLAQGLIVLIRDYANPLIQADLAAAASS
ncbi:MAG TPA: nuclear transport factor 2 family protein [Microlunatus sp.]